MHRRIIGIIILLCCAHVVFAGEISWINPAGGSWADTLNWNTHKIPGLNDTVHISMPGTYVVTFPFSKHYAAKLVNGGVGSTPILNLGSRLVVTTEVINWGTIELIGNGTGSSNLTAVVVRNYGLLSTLEGDSTGARQFQSSVENFGSMNIQFPAYIYGGGPANSNTGTMTITADLNVFGGLTNSGTIHVTSGVTLFLNGGTFTHSSGSLSGGGRTYLNNFTTATFNQNISLDSIGLGGVNSTMNGSGIITIPSGENLTITNSTINNHLENSGTIGVYGPNLSQFTDTLITYTGSLLHIEGRLSVLKGFQSNGKIELLGELSPSGKTLVNNDTIAIPSNAANPSLSMRLDNQEVVIILHSASLGSSSGAHTNSGTMSINANLTVSGGLVNSGTLDISSGQSLVIGGSSFTYNSGLLSGGGTLQLLTLGSASFNQNLSLSGINLYVVNTTVGGTGAITVSAGNSFSIVNSAVNNVLHNAGLINVTGGNGTFFNGAFTNEAGSMLRVDAGGGGRLYFTNGFTNFGTIELTNTGGPGNPVTLDVTNGTLVNHDTMKVLKGSGAGYRAISALIDNKGIMQIENSMTLSKTGVTHHSSGAIILSKGVEVIASSPIIFTSPGVVHFDIGGNSVATGLSRFNITGQPSFGGTLDIALVNGYIPEPGDTLSLINYSSFRNDFSSIRVPTSQGLPLLDTRYTPTSLRVFGLFNVQLIPELPLATDVQDTLKPGAFHLYKISKSNAQFLLARAITQDTSRPANLYISFNTIPSRWLFEYRSKLYTDQLQEVFVPATTAGFYFLLVHNPELSTVVQTLRADIPDYSIRWISPSSVGNDGEVTLRIIGARFNDSSRIYIRKPGSDSIEARTVIFVNEAELVAKIALNNVSAGAYDVVVVDPDSGDALMPGGLAIVSSSPPNLDISLTGPSQIRRIRPATLNLNLYNPMNVNADRVIVEVRTPFVLGVQEMFISAPVSPYPYQPGVVTGVSTTIDSALQQKFFTLVYSNLGPGETRTVPLTVTFKYNGVYKIFGDIFLMSKANFDSAVVQTYRTSIDSGWLVDDSVNAITPLMITANATSSALAGCPYAGLEDEEALCEVFENNERLAEQAEEAKGIVQDAAEVVNLNPFKKPKKPWKIIKFLKKLSDWADKWNAKDVPLGEPEGVSSVDPNDIITPFSSGMLHWIRPQQLTYTIQCENDPDSATAPAQIVRIVHRLDSTLNRTTVTLGTFSIGDSLFTVPTGLDFYATRLDLRNSLNLYVDLTAGLYGDSLVWLFESLDPNTLLPPLEAQAGFLPVNDSTGKGEASVSYSVFAQDTLSTGRRISAQAKIYFDDNDPIFTPVRFNTIDKGNPVTSMHSLKAESPTTFTIRWSGSDDAGIASYQVLVSEDGTPFDIWLSGYSDTTAEFTGLPGKTYGFFTIAVDTAGNQESAKFVSETSTIITGVNETSPTPQAFVLYQNYPNPFNPLTNIRYAVPRQSFVTLKIYNLLGQEVASLVNEEKLAGSYQARWNANGYSSGVYFFRLTAGPFTSVKKMSLIK